MQIHSIVVHNEYGPTSFLKSWIHQLFLLGIDQKYIYMASKIKHGGGKSFQKGEIRFLGQAA